MAMWMGRLTRDPSWLREMLGAKISAAGASDIRDQLRALMLVSARWMLVMVFFERELYRDPDRPDLNRLWWDLVGQMQLIPRPEGRDEPDWATKNHLSNAPVYYHNYLLGELMASQFDAALKGGNDSGPQGWRDPGLGQFFRERVFAPGASVTWDQLAEHATGEPLSGRFFAEQFVGT
jgi:peptidyl-dipeptidase A